MFWFGHALPFVYALCFQIMLHNYFHTLINYKMSSHHQGLLHYRFLSKIRFTKGVQFFN